MNKQIISLIFIGLFIGTMALDVNECWKNTYAKGLLAKCKEGYKGFGFVCVQSCDGTAYKTDCGYYCGSDAAYCTERNKAIGDYFKSEWNNLIKNPDSRAETVKGVVDKVKGRTMC